MAEQILNDLRGNDRKKLQKLLKNKTLNEDVNRKYFERQTTFLHEACKYGQTQVAKHLLGKGATVNIVCKKGWTPLHKAASWCRFECVKLLLENGAKINVCTRAANTPLHLAAQNVQKIYHQRILKDNQLKDQQIIRENLQIIKLLLDAGSDVNARNYLGRTPLYNAAAQGNLPVISLLVDRGADVNLRDHRRQTPVDVARENKNFFIVEWFIEAEVHEGIYMFKKGHYFFHFTNF
jgi:ankyrin repeat protein